MLSISDLNFTTIPGTTTRLLSGSVSGGPGAAGLIFRLEASSDLQRWEGSTTLTADAAGTASFSLFAPANRRARFVRARFS